MPFHFCTDELLAILAMIPFIGLFFRRIHTWYHTKFHHKCHEKSCAETHVDHSDAPWVSEEDILAEDIARLDLEEPGWDKAAEESFTLPPRGLVVGTVLSHGPMTHEQVLGHLPNEDADTIHSTINELVEEGALILDGDLLKEGNIFAEPDNDS